MKKEIENIINTTKINKGSGLSANSSCAMIIDIIFDKVSEILNNDKKISGFSRSFITRLIKKGKIPIQDYVENMDKKEAEDIIIKIKTAIDVYDKYIERSK